MTSSWPKYRSRSRQHLTGLLWGEKPEDKARHSLREAARVLRRGLGEDGLIADTDWLRLGAVTPFFRIPRKLAGSRMYEENKTIRASVAVHRETNEMLVNQLGMVPFKWRYGYAHAKAVRQGYTRDDPTKTIGYFYRLTRTICESYHDWARTTLTGEIRSFGRWFARAVKNQTKRLQAY